MSYFFKILDCFKKKAKKYRKKFPSLKQDIIDTLKTFEKYSGDALGGGNFKVRLRCRSLKKGKSKSFRLILHLREENCLIIPICIYFKSDRETLSKSEINQDLADAITELESQKGN